MGFISLEATQLVAPKALRLVVGLLFGLMALNICTAGLPVAVDGQALPSLAPMLERVTPAVVNISTVNVIRDEEQPLLSDPFFRHFFDLPRKRESRRNQSLGSGFVWNTQAVI